ncbi:hypothetical protein CKO25_06665 [Thiocapsa imhoffii]|uniref:BREX system P-loop protein BrxC n=1 Tax=Thiocapsa imhoffii TaxID=382777 RepID=A0A9X1B827_9GAMM|nr:BREX system P-loop protein BrxC [Thiocapsa imhoffii]MBK1644342.1 hypothetical protein [Thiocapsa imhoffii]
MQNRELFLKDPLTWQIANEGVSSNNVEDPDTLRYELDTFVCQGEYQTGLAKILQGYLDSLGKEQKAAWVSGFYGSGKSHLVKVLRYLWTDFALPGGVTARTLATLPQDIVDLLKELSTRGKQGAGLHSAGGTMKAGVGSVRLRLAGIALLSVGLPENLSVARLLMDLRDEGTLADIQERIRQAGKDPAQELGRLYTSRALHEAYLAHHPHLGDIKNVSEALRSQYPAKLDEISIDEMLLVVRRALMRNGQLPCTVIVLDEVQQFINNSPDVAHDVQEVVEALSKELDGRVLVVGTGQSALTDTPALQRLMGRFTTKVHLKDNDVEKVVRTVVLQKKQQAKAEISDLVSKRSGEITRQLKSTRLAARAEDDASYVPDYPLLPVRRRFWEQVLHSCDPSGSAAQMRTQLRVTHEACRLVAERPVGAIIPADFIYDQQASELVISGELQKRFQEIIEEQKTRPDGTLRSRICALVFLINKLPREGADSGVRATPEHLADLLTDDLGDSATTLRATVPALVQDLVSDGVLMEIEGEYYLQTTEGAAWESEFRRRRTALLNNEPQLAAQRGQLLSKAVQAALAGVNVLHGAAKVKRKVTPHHGMSPPPVTDDLTVWVRDGFQESETAVIQDIQQRSVADATIHVLIPKIKADALKNALASALATEETLNFKGQPSGEEGKEARRAMVTRQAREEAKVESLVSEIVGGARLFLSGGQERPVVAMKDATEDAARDVLDRLYPQFHVADSANWPTVWKKAKDGSAGALGAVNHAGDPHKHPVTAAILSYVGAGKKGSEIVAHFGGGSFGWPKDAIQAGMAVLMVSGHLGARIQGQPVKIADLDQNKIGQADFRVEHPVLTAIQKLKIKKLFQAAGHKFQPGDEASAAPGFVNLLGDLARSAGGNPPAPAAPQAPEVTALQGLSGNDLLFGLHEKADVLTQRIADWKATADKIAQRAPAFSLAEQLLDQAAGIAGMDAEASTLEAIRANRSLLDDPDPTSTVLKAVGTALRGALAQAQGRYAATLAAEQAKLNAHPTWSALSSAKQAALLQAAGIYPLPMPGTDSDEDLLAALKARDLSAWQTLTDALPTRFDQALAAAIKEAEPKAQRVFLPGATIHDEAELEDWLAAARAEIASALEQGPVIL